MRKKYFLWLFFLSCFCGSVMTSSGRTVILPDLEKPRVFKVDESRIYITEGPRIYIYSKKDFTLLKKFGKSGDGPDEFVPTFTGRKRIYIDVQADNIVVTSEERISFFSKNGEFIESMAAPPQSGNYYKSGDFLVGLKYIWERGKMNATDAVMVLQRKGRGYKGIAKFYSTRPGGGSRIKLSIGGKRDYGVIRHYFGYCVSDNRIYVADTANGFFIGVYDIKGNKINEIRKEYQKLKISDSRKKTEMEKFKETNMWKYIEHINPVFPEYFPAFRVMRVSKGKIYLHTYAEQKTGDTTREEVLVLDAEGTVVQRVFVPTARFADVYDGKYYYLEKNQDEEWELKEDKNDRIDYK